MNNLSIIVAVDENNGIGYRNQLPWRLSNDLKRFKQLTTGNVVVMGRKTWESLPKKPLPERINVVLTRNSIDLPVGVQVFSSVKEFIQQDYSPKTIFIIGGAEIYRQFFPLASTLYLTRVHGKFETDTHLEGFIPDEWELISSLPNPQTEKDSCPYTFEVFRRK